MRGKEEERGKGRNAGEGAESDGRDRESHYRRPLVCFIIPAHGSAILASGFFAGSLSTPITLPNLLLSIPGDE